MNYLFIEDVYKKDNITFIFSGIRESTESASCKNVHENIDSLAFCENWNTCYIHYSVKIKGKNLPKFLHELQNVKIRFSMMYDNFQDNTFAIFVFSEINSMEIFTKENFYEQLNSEINRINKKVEVLIHLSERR